VRIDAELPDDPEWIDNPEIIDETYWMVHEAVADTPIHRSTPGLTINEWSTIR